MQLIQRLVLATALLATGLYAQEDSVNARSQVEQPQQQQRDDLSLNGLPDHRDLGKKKKKSGGKKKKASKKSYMYDDYFHKKPTPTTTEATTAATTPYVYPKSVEHTYYKGKGKGGKMGGSYKGKGYYVDEHYPKSWYPKTAYPEYYKGKGGSGKMDGGKMNSYKGKGYYVDEHYPKSWEATQD